jgi:hypothetical protein
MNTETNSVQKRAFELLYDEFRKISYMAHWGSGYHRPPTGTTRMLYRWTWGVERFPSPPSFGDIRRLFREDPVSFDHH